MNTPLVSICCVTYNHAQFIRKCLDGFLLQQTDFPIEILIHDDCSTDGTTEIIREYEAKYPDLIFPLYEEENQYQHGKAAEIDFYNYRRARGKYIAYCEGDDYWTDPLKLQKQVDFMEANPEYSVCFHNFYVIDNHTNTRKCPINLHNNSNIDGIDITSDMYIKNSFYGQPLTMIFRVSMYDFQWYKKYRYYRDTHEIYHLLNEGKGRILNFIGGVYSLHDGGIASSLSIHKTAKGTMEICKELYVNNSRDRVIQKFLYSVLLWNYDVLKNEFWVIWIKCFLISPVITTQVLFTIIKRKIKKLNYNYLP